MLRPWTKFKHDDEQYHDMPTTATNNQQHLFMAELKRKGGTAQQDRQRANTKDCKSAVSLSKNKNKKNLTGTIVRVWQRSSTGNPAGINSKRTFPSGRQEIVHRVPIATRRRRQPNHLNQALRKRLKKKADGQLARVVTPARTPYGRTYCKTQQSQRPHFDKRRRAHSTGNHSPGTH